MLSKCLKQAQKEPSNGIMYIYQNFCNVQITEKTTVCNYHRKLQVLHISSKIGVMNEISVLNLLQGILMIHPQHKNPSLRPWKF